MKLRIFILFLFLPILSVQAGIIDSLMIHPRDSIGLTSDSLVLRYLQESGIPISDNNKVKLLKSGREKFIDLFEAIREAKHHVHLEYFNFRNDSIANALFALLAEKVKEGVEVRAMFDAFGNWSNNKPLKDGSRPLPRRSGANPPVRTDSRYGSAWIRCRKPRKSSGKSCF